MDPFALDIKDAITIVTGICTLAGVVFTLRGAVSKLESGQTEMLRQIGALHKRMDRYGARISEIEVNHAVLEERVQNMRQPGLRESQRFRLRGQPEELVPVDQVQDIFPREDTE